MYILYKMHDDWLNFKLLNLAGIYN